MNKIENNAQQALHLTAKHKKVFAVYSELFVFTVARISTNCKVF